MTEFTHRLLNVPACVGKSTWPTVFVPGHWKTWTPPRLFRSAARRQYSHRGDTTISAFLLSPVPGVRFLRPISTYKFSY